MWDEFSGFGKPAQLVAFDESGEVRTLYPTDGGRFFAGPGAAVPASIESRVEFQRDRTGKITSLTWRTNGAPARVGRRVEIEYVKTFAPLVAVFGTPGSLWGSIRSANIPPLPSF